MTDQDVIDALATAVVDEYTQAGLTLATAESCTGGWIAKAITDIAGSSACLGYGLVTYSNAAKSALLGVKPATLESFGAVSEPTVREMAEGVLEVSGANCSVAVSGIAGPSGGSAEKPVGTVWFGVALEGECHAVRRQFPSLGRDWIRGLAAQTALDLARRALEADRLADLA